MHPGSGISATQVAALQCGADGVPGTVDDVLVLGYISIGEDSRFDRPQRGDGSGPRVAPGPSSKPFAFS